MAPVVIHKCGKERAKAVGVAAVQALAQGFSVGDGEASGPDVEMMAR